MSEQHHLIYITTENKTEAVEIGKQLVEKRLAACVNIIEHMTSFYWWAGKVEEGQETVLIAKTKASLIKELTEAVKTLHSYDCPCVVVLPIEGGNPDFLHWITTETK
ncbi:MAG: divalent-cation tolerance protein CutA [SAR324 cluster bacterium]|nr:divalent-cation tolerance protein CutA [SAR324 cluster bacterium]